MKNINFITRKGDGILLSRLILFIILCFFIPALASSQILCHPQLVWHDEFNTPGNLSQWLVYEGDGCNQSSGCGFGNSELELYKAANAVVADTTLTITTIFQTVVNPVDNKTFKYTSAKLMSKLTNDTTLQSFLFGRVEARIKLPSGGGVWPGFWMLATAGGWPTTGEIDIMEAKNKNPMTVNGTIHYAYPAGVHQSSGSTFTSTVDLSADYHVYAVEWSPYQIKWYVDSTLYLTQTPETTVGGSWPFDASKMYIILNVAVGGPNTPFTGKVAPVSTDYPTTMKVDYVRVYSGIYNYAVFGKNAVFPNETYQDYHIDSVPGASAYNWTVPAGATIVSGQGTNLITVSWGTTPGDVTVAVSSSGCTTQTFSRSVTMRQPLVLDKLYDDFQTNRIATYGPYTGTLAQPVANPGPGRVNTSTLVGQYTRNAGSQYDDMYISNIPVPNAMDYVQGKKELFVDVYTNAPVGSEIDMQLENTSLSFVNPFPSGRHSKYTAFTTRQNSWETLEFDYSQTISNSNTDMFSIDKMVLLPEPGNFTGSVYYFDNVRVLEQPSAKWTTIATDTLLNYDGTARLSFDNTITSGVYTPMANPSATGINISANAAKYIRNDTSAYDVLFFNAGTSIPDAAPYKSQVYQLQMDVYSSTAPGTIVSINLQNKALSVQAYPCGRNSSYEAVTTKQNQWETLTFYYSSAPNGVSDLLIDQLAVLFSPNKPGADTFYIDNIRIGKKVVYTGSSAYEDYDSTNLFTYQQSDGVYTPNFANPAPGSINTSAKTGKYKRNPAAPYDVLVFSTAAIKDGESFKQGNRLFAMDLYTTAPVGTVLSWSLESSAKSLPANYPKGRHSNYQGIVAQTNAWQTVYFYLQAIPDPGTLDDEVDRVSLLFAANSTDSSTYYIDNLRAMNGTTSQTPTGLPLPWQNKDIGTVTAAGSATFSNNVFTLKASGADIYSTADQFQYVYQPITGDVTIIARVDSLTNTNASAKACVMVRESLDANAKEVNTLVKAGGGTALSYRSSTGGSTTSVNTSGNPPKWLKLVRAGDVFTSSRSDNGTTWTQISSKTIPMNSAVFVGMGATSHNNGVLTTAMFSNVSVIGSNGSTSSTVLFTGENEAANNTTLKLYPNPAKNLLTVQWQGNADKIMVYDVSGQLLQTKQLSPGLHSTQLNIAPLPQGMYIVNIRLGNDRQVLKFIKE